MGILDSEALDSLVHRDSKRAGLFCLLVVVLCLVINANLPGRAFASRRSVWHRVFPFLDYFVSSSDASADKITSEDEAPFQGNRRETRATPHVTEIGLEIRNFHKKFGSFTAVQPGLNLRMRRGEVYALLGPNGAGKSTTIRCLLGLESPTEGRIGVPVAAQTNSDGMVQMGVCFQENTIRTKMSAWAHLELMASIRGIPRHQRALEISRVLEIVQLTQGDIIKPAGRLSGGQQRRLCAAMALVGSPQIVVLDEPTSGIDPATRHAIWDAIRQEREGKVVLLTTHFMEEAEYLADRLAIIAEGQLQCEGSLSYLKSAFSTPSRVTIHLDRQAVNFEHPSLPAATSAASSVLRELLTAVLGAQHNRASVEIAGGEVKVLVPFDLTSALPAVIEALEHPSFREKLNKAYAPVATAANANVYLSSTLTAGRLNEVFFAVVAEAEKRARQLRREAETPSPSAPAEINSPLLTPEGATEEEQHVDAMDAFLKFSSEAEAMRVEGMTVGRFFKGLWAILQSKIKAKSILGYFMETYVSWAMMLIVCKYAAMAVSAAVTAEGPLTESAFLSVVAISVMAFLFWCMQIHSALIADVESGMHDLMLVTGVPAVSLVLGGFFDAWLRLMVLQFGSMLIFATMLPSLTAVRIVFSKLDILLPALLYFSAACFLICSLVFLVSRLLPLKMLMRILAVGVGLYMLLTSIARVVIVGMSNGSKKITFLHWDQIWSNPISRFIERVIGSYVCGNEDIGPMEIIDELCADVKSWNFDLYIIGCLLGYIVLALVVEYGINNPYFRRTFSLWYWAGRRVALSVTDPFKYDDGTPLYPPDNLSNILPLQSVIDEAAAVVAMGPEAHPVVVRRAKKVYNLFAPQTAVRGVSFHVKKGECLGYLGVNGAGKSSTLNMLVGTELMNGGEAHIEGQSVTTRLGRARAHLGYCPQHSVIWPHATGLFHLQFFASSRGLDGALYNKYIRLLIKALDMSSFIKKKAGEYSGGMKRRLSVAMALVGNPSVVLLDEPTSGVDPVSRQQLWRLIQSTMQGRSTILTTHSMDEAEALSDHIAIMSKGQLRCLGTTRELRMTSAQSSGTLAVEYEVTVPAGASAVAANAAVCGLMRRHLHAEGVGAPVKFHLAELLDARGLVEVEEAVQGANVLSSLKVLRVCQRLQESGLLKSFAVSHISLEHVFLKVAEEAGQAEAKRISLQEVTTPYDPVRAEQWGA